MRIQDRGVPCPALVKTTRHINRCKNGPQQKQLCKTAEELVYTSAIRWEEHTSITQQATHAYRNGWMEVNVSDSKCFSK